LRALTPGLLAKRSDDCLASSRFFEIVNRVQPHKGTKAAMKKELGARPLKAPLKAQVFL
jgi:hypothetical protein